MLDSKQIAKDAIKEVHCLLENEFLTEEQTMYAITCVCENYAEASEKADAALINVVPITGENAS